MAVVPLAWTKPPLTKNDTRRQGHHHVMRRKWSDALDAARYAIRAAKVKPLDGRVIVLLHWQQPDKRRRDGDGAFPTLSACLDALVLEGVIPDDSWTYVAHSGVTVHEPRPGTPGQLWLDITPAPNPPTEEATP